MKFSFGKIRNFTHLLSCTKCWGIHKIVFVLLNIAPVQPLCLPADLSPTALCSELGVQVTEVTGTPSATLRSDHRPQMCILFAQSVNTRYIWLQLIWIEIQNILLTAETRDLGARGLSNTAEGLKPRNKISKVALSYVKETLHFSCLCRDSK
jgi:hypothetical protein